METLHCKYCGIRIPDDTVTRLCNDCWELSRRVQAKPDIARHILAERTTVSGAVFELTAVLFAMGVTLFMDLIDAALRKVLPATRTMAALGALLLASQAFSQSERPATPGERREQQCAAQKQRCVERVWPRVVELREKCQAEIDQVVRVTKVKAVLVTITALATQGRSGAVLGLVGAEDLNESTLATMQSIRNSYELRVKGVLAECRLEERCESAQVQAPHWGRTLAWVGILTGSAIVLSQVLRTAAPGGSR